MLTKEDCTQALNDMKMYGGINIPLLAFDIFDKLIEVHFNPQPLKFEELHENMWVYDVKNKCCIYIEELTVDNPMMIIRYPMSNRESNCEWCNFEESRFYPIIIPNTGDKNG